MKICKKCGESFKYSVVIDGRRRNLSSRKFCLNCSPFGKHNTRDISAPHYVKHPSWTPERRKQEYAKRAKRRKEELVELMGGKCAICGYNKSTCAFDFHHIDPEHKKYEIATLLANRRWSIILEESKKCILLCSNCHREVEAGITICPIEKDD